jgi:hypothetical protein
VDTLASSDVGYCPTHANTVIKQGSGFSMIGGFVTVEFLDLDLLHLLNATVNALPSNTLVAYFKRGY